MSDGAPQGEPGGFPAELGIELLDEGPEVARARMPVTGRIMQPYGIVHGGAIAALAETVTSWATMQAVRADGMLAMGQANDTSFLRPISKGFVHAVARRKHHGRTTWVWEVEVTDDDERLCALVRMTIAIRPGDA